MADGQDSDIGQHTVESFAGRVRAAYPEGMTSDGKSYSSIPDQELVKRVIDKYPVYQNWLTTDTLQNLASPHTESKGLLGEIGEYAGQIGKNIAGMTAPVQLYRAGEGLLKGGIRGLAEATPIGQAIGGFMAETEKAGKLMGQPGILPKVQAAGHTLAADVPFLGPLAATGAEQLTTGEPGKGLANITTVLGGLALPKAMEEAEAGGFGRPSPESLQARESSGIKMLKEGLKGGRNVEENIARATPYLKEIGRSNPKSMADIHAGLDAHRARIGTALQEQAMRHPEIRVSGDDVAADIRSTAKSIDTKLFPKVGEAIEAEASRYDGKQLTAPEALEAAATLRAMKQSYFNAPAADQVAAERASGSVRAIDSAHDQIVDRLAERLEATGEKNVKGMRADYGALRNLTDAAYKAKVRAGQTPAPSYGKALIKQVVRHPVESFLGAPLTPGIAALRYLGESRAFPENVAVRGITQLGRIPGGLPDYTPTRPTISGLLPAGPLITPPPSDVSYVRGEPATPDVSAAERLMQEATKRLGKKPVLGKAKQE